MSKFRGVIKGEPAVAGKNFAHDAHHSDLLEAFINRHKAGSPTDAKCYWTHLKPKELACLFKAEQGIEISHGMVKRKLFSMGFKYRKLHKKSSDRALC